MMPVLCRRSCALLMKSRMTAVASFSSTPNRSRDRFYIDNEPASVTLPDSYTGQIQGVQGREHEFAANRARDSVDQDGKNVESMMKNEEIIGGDDIHAEVYDDSCNVSLHSVMQSNVPEPYGRGSPTHLNMPGSGVHQRNRIVNNQRVDLKRELHMSAHVLTQDSAELAYQVSRQDFQPPAAQGIQGDINQDCTFKLWLENCHRYNLDCDEMLQGIQSGRKTLSQVFREQDEMIQRVVKESKRD